MFRHFVKRRATWAVTVVGAVVLVIDTLLAQGPPAKNPRQGDAEAVRTGATEYLIRCVECHGVDAKGVRGPDLTALWESDSSDARLFQIIRRGVPGTEMPANLLVDEDIWALLAYLRTLSSPDPTEPLTGNAENGERIFWAQCGGCHRVNNRGGRLGPDLSRIGSSRSRSALMRKIRDPNALIVKGYEPVTLVTSDGQQIRGARKNEDAYSIQVMDTRERLRGYLKASLKEVIDDNRSLMPAFGADRLNDRDLDDVLRFLGGLRRVDAIRP